MEKAQWPGWVSAKSTTLWLPDVTGQASRAPPVPGGTKSRAKRLLPVLLRVLGINACAECPRTRVSVGPWPISRLTVKMPPELQSWLKDFQAAPSFCLYNL